MADQAPALSPALAPAPQRPSNTTILAVVAAAYLVEYVAGTKYLGAWLATATAQFLAVRTGAIRLLGVILAFLVIWRAEVDTNNAILRKVFMGLSLLGIWIITGVAVLGFLGTFTDLYVMLPVEVLGPNLGDTGTLFVTLLHRAFTPLKLLPPLSLLQRMMPTSYTCMMGGGETGASSCSSRLGLPCRRCLSGKHSGLSSLSFWRRNRRQRPKTKRSDCPPDSESPAPTFVIFSTQSFIN
jgi:hypothetical protein